MSRFRRAHAVLVTALLTAASLVVPAQPASAANGEGAGFVWFDNLSLPLGATYTPSPNYQYNSTSPFTAINTIKHDLPGVYWVTFPHLTGDGVAHVTAYGSDGWTCRPHARQPDDQIGIMIVVYCQSPDAVQADHRFTISYTNVKHPYAGRPMAYALIDGYDGTIYPTGTFNSSGAANSVSHDGQGSYTVVMPNLASWTGHVQVTAWNGFPDICHAAYWVPYGADLIVHVECFDWNGNPDNTNFEVTYVDQLNILGLSTGFNPDGHESDYAWADQPWAPLGQPYVPHTSYQFSDYTNTNATITHDAVGSYTVKFAYANLNNGNVQVTTYGWGQEYCTVAYWNSTGIRVRCYSLGATPVDSFFTVAFTGPFVIG